jgi:hypothetical protein
MYMFMCSYAHTCLTIPPRRVRATYDATGASAEPFMAGGPFFREGPSPSHLAAVCCGSHGGWKRVLNLSIYLSIRPSVYLSIYPFIYLSIYLSIHVYTRRVSRGGAGPREPRRVPLVRQHSCLPRVGSSGFHGMLLASLRIWHT